MIENSKRRNKLLLKNNLQLSQSKQPNNINLQINNQSIKKQQSVSQRSIQPQQSFYQLPNHNKNQQRQLHQIQQHQLTQNLNHLIKWIDYQLSSQIMQSKIRDDVIQHCSSYYMNKDTTKIKNQSRDSNQQQQQIQQQQSNNSPFQLSIFTPQTIKKIATKRVQKMIRNKKIKKNWSSQDIKLLIWVVSKYVQHQQIQNLQELGISQWKIISKLISGSQPQICMFKWLGLKKTSLQANKWKQYQENLLKKTVLELGTKNWKKVSQQMYKNMLSQQKQSSIISFRSPKQCRQHWICYLNPKLKKGPWQSQQDLLLMKKIRQINGAKRWSQIVQFFDGRTQNALKNRYNLLIEKQKKKNKQLVINKINNHKQQNQIRVKEKPFEKSKTKSNIEELDLINSFIQNAQIQQFLMIQQRYNQEPLFKRQKNKNKMPNNTNKNEQDQNSNKNQQKQQKHQQAQAIEQEASFQLFFNKNSNDMQQQNEKEQQMSMSIIKGNIKTEASQIKCQRILPGFFKEHFSRGQGLLLEAKNIISGVLRSQPEALNLNNKNYKNRNKNLKINEQTKNQFICQN